MKEKRKKEVEAVEPSVKNAKNRTKAKVEEKHAVKSANAPVKINIKHKIVHFPNYISPQ